jgi:HlyD family secretion protein
MREFVCFIFQNYTEKPPYLLLLFITFTVYMKRIYWIILLGVIVIAALLIARAMQGAKPTDVIIEKAALRNIIEVVSATGKIQPEAELKITSDVSGEITELLVKEGDQVKKGTLLCRIKPDIYESAIDRVDASVKSSIANLKTSKAQLEQAKSSLANTQATFERSKKLLDQNAISQQDFDAAKSQYEAAKANVDAIEETINAGSYNVKGVEASLKEAKTNLDKTFIYAPVDGTVSKLNVEKGERVSGVTGLQGTEILRLANLNEMEVSVEVNENDIVKVHKNDTALIEVDAYMDKKFKGIVTEIANSSNSNGISVDQVTNFVVKVRVLRDSYTSLISESNPAPFRPGMSASVDIQTRRVSQVVSVPIQAVTIRNKDSIAEQKESLGPQELKVKNDLEEQEKKKTEEEELKELVFVIKDGTAITKQVKTGVQDNDYIQIVSGLNKDEEVISGPYSAVSKSLKEGNKVKVIDKSELYKLK